MTSQVDPTKPPEGTALTADIRQNFQYVKDEIEELQEVALPVPAPEDEGKSVKATGDGGYELFAFPSVSFTGAWEDDVTYTQNQVVSFQGTSYFSQTDDNLNNQPDESPSDWGLVTDVGMVWVGPWEDDVDYFIGAAVEHEGSSYIATDESTDEEPPNINFWDLIARKGFGVWRGNWSAITAYAVDDAVFHNGSSYIAIAATTNNEPPHANWNLLSSGTSWESTWSGATAYKVNDVVYFHGASFLCILAHTNQEPPNGTYWQYMSRGMVFIAAWSGATAYKIDDVVSSAGSAYVCIQAHTNQAPPNATYWTVLASKGDTGDTGATGAAGLSEDFFFAKFRYENVFFDALGLNWTVVDGTDAQAIAPTITGIQGLRLRAGDDAAGTMATNGSKANLADYISIRSLLNGTGASHSIEIKLAYINELTDVCFFFGLTDSSALEMPFTMGAGNAVTSIASDAVGFLYDSAADTDNWWAVAVDADVDATPQNTTIAPAENQKLRIELSINGSFEYNANFYINDVLRATILNGFSSPGLVTFALFSRGAATREASIAHFRAFSDG